MDDRSSKRWGLLAASLCVVAAGLGLVPVAARAAEPASPAQVRTVAPIAFLPVNSECNFAVEQGGLGRLCPFKGAGYFVAPLQFNDGTRIEAIAVFLEDSSPTVLGMLSLARRRPGAFEILATTPVSIGTGKVEALSTEAITAPLVDNQWSYVLQVVLSGPGVCLHGARVTYRAP